MSDQEAKRIGRCSDYSVRVYPAPDPVTPPAPADPTYKYGWPGDLTNTEEPDVVAQWLFEETSGSIVDTVQGITLDVVGTPNFAASLNPLYPYTDNIKKGVIYNETAYHMSAGADTRFDLTNKDFVFEYYVFDTQAYNGTTIFDTKDATTGRGYAIWHQGGALRSNMTFKSEDDVTVTVDILWGFTNNSPVRIVNRPVKFRYVGNWTTNTVSVYVDGTLANTASIAALNGKEIKCHNLVVADDIGHVNFKSLYGHLYELRVTIGNSTNNSGGPNGG